MARLVVTVQMLADLAVVVIRLILGAATRGVERLRGSPTRNGRRGV